MLKSTKAFTLAEVLITLGIIGVVAALTIPSLVSNIQDSQYRNQWKNIFTELNEAYKQMMSDYPSIGDMCSIGDPQLDSNCFVDKLPGYMKLLSSCHTDGGGQNACTTGYSDVRYLNGSDSGGPINDNAGATMVNGAMLNITWISNASNPNACQPNMWWYDEVDDAIYPNKCVYGFIYVDVNGKQNPNQFGKDIYQIYLTDKNVYPSGAAYTMADENRVSYHTGCNLSSDSLAQGMTCAADYLLK